MDYIEDMETLKFPPNILQEIRRLYGMDKPGVMDEAIDILDGWVKKQSHFTRKDFGRSYLERVIIRAKGSIERAKQRLDRTCTARTLLPTLFVKFTETNFRLDDFDQALMPKMTKNYYRINIIRQCNQKVTPDFYTRYFQRALYVQEYLCAHDYSNGIINILDLVECNILDIIKNVNVSELSQVSELFFNAYGFRLKAIHVISSSKLIELILNILRSVFTEKIQNRIIVHKSIETLGDYVDRDLLPEDYGGKELPLAELSRRLLEEISSTDYIKYIDTLLEAKTDEASRTSASSFDGIQGTFRNLRVD